MEQELKYDMSWNYNSTGLAVSSEWSYQYRYWKQETKFMSTEQQSDRKQLKSITVSRHISESLNCSQFLNNENYSNFSILIILLSIMML